MKTAIPRMSHIFVSLVHATQKDYTHAELIQCGARSTICECRAHRKATTLPCQFAYFVRHTDYQSLASDHN